MLKKLWLNYSYFFTLFFFILGFFNIVFAWLGFFCLIMPFVLALKDKTNSWCQGFCPRSNLFTKLFKNINSTSKPTPKFLLNGKGKTVMLIYFLLNLFVICMSTLMVLLDKREPLEKIKFLIAFQLPWNIPQFLDIGVMPDWVIHLGFRVYSMMFTTVILGLLLGLLYKPRTWCLICPMGNLTNMTLKQKHTSKTIVNSLQ